MRNYFFTSSDGGWFHFRAIRPKAVIIEANCAMAFGTRQGQENSRQPNGRATGERAAKCGRLCPDAICILARDYRSRAGASQRDQSGRNPRWEEEDALTFVIRIANENDWMLQSTVGRLLGEMAVDRRTGLVYQPAGKMRRLPGNGRQ